MVNVGCKTISVIMKPPSNFSSLPSAAALKLKNQSPAGKSQEGLMAEQKAARALDEVLGLKSEGAPQ